MLVCEVALGKCQDVFEFNHDLTSAPDGFDSVHGVRGREGVNSKFKVCHNYALLTAKRPRGCLAKLLFKLFKFLFYIFFLQKYVSEVHNNEKVKT